MSGQDKNPLPSQERLQTISPEHSEWREASVIIENLRKEITFETNLLLIPFHHGLRILGNVNEYLTGSYFGHMSWTLTFFKRLESKEKRKEEEKENARRTS